MPTPVYYGAIGVMNARHMYCPARRNSLPTCIIGALRAAFQRVSATGASDSGDGASWPAWIVGCWPTSA